MNAKDIAGLVHHSNHGSQYTSIKYSEKLADYGIKSATEPWAIVMITPWPRQSSLYKTELIYSQAWLMHRG